MREYKFRGRSIEPLVGDDQWLYGFGVHVVELTDGGKEYWLYTDNGTYQVDPETVGQYTGLKDRNGKEIYESHKVKFRKYMDEYTGVVRFEKGCFIVKWESVVGAYGEKATHSEYLKNCENIEIIGDLLEGEI